MTLSSASLFTSPARFTVDRLDELDCPSFALRGENLKEVRTLAGSSSLTALSSLTVGKSDETADRVGEEVCR